MLALSSYHSIRRRVSNISNGRATMRLWLSLSVLFCLAGCQKASGHVVLYCAQDREFAESLLADFTRQTGIQVEPRYDTEANKSVSLFESLVREKSVPRCDV